MFHGSSAEVLMHESRVFGAFFCENLPSGRFTPDDMTDGDATAGNIASNGRISVPEAAKLYLYLRGTSGVA